MRSPFIFVGQFSLFLEGGSGLSLVAGFLFSLIGFAINISNAPSGMIICVALTFHVHIILRGPVNVGWGITSLGNTNAVWAWHFRLASGILGGYCRRYYCLTA
jgi:hypothetical protein